MKASYHDNISCHQLPLRHNFFKKLVKRLGLGCNWHLHTHQNVSEWTQDSGNAFVAKKMYTNMPSISKYIKLKSISRNGTTFAMRTHEVHKTALNNPFIFLHCWICCPYCPFVCFVFLTFSFPLGTVK